MHIKEIPKDINCVKLYHSCNVDPRGYQTFQNAVYPQPPGFQNYKIRKKIVELVIRCRNTQ